MAIDVSQFVAPENKWEGLTNLSDKIEKREYRDNVVKQEAAKGRDASLKFFTNYLDKKDKFTGTPYDPKQFELIDNAFVQASDLIRKGASDVDIMTAIHPLVSKANDYNLAARNYSAGKKELLANAKSKTGIDVDLLSKSMDENAFYETDPKTGQLVEKADFSTINPDASIYADLALRNNDVFNNAGFDDFAKKSKTNTNLVSIKTTDANGRSVLGKAEVEGQNYLVPDLDVSGRHKTLVPKYTIAQDAGNEIIHTFEGDKGNPTDAPIRLLADDVFLSLPPETLGYVRQEARKYAKAKGIPLSSSQAENLAKAIAYDELNSPSRKQENTKFINETKEPKAATVKVTVNNGGGKGGDVTINDIHKEVNDKYESGKGQFGEDYKIPLNELSATAQGVVIKYANDLRGKDSNITQEDVYLTKGTNGNFNIVDKETQTVIAPIGFKDINLKTQPSAKEKKSVIQKAKDMIRGGGSKTKNTQTADDL